MGPSVQLTIFAVLCSRDPSHCQLEWFSTLLKTIKAGCVHTTKTNTSFQFSSTCCVKNTNHSFSYFYGQKSKKIFNLFPCILCSFPKGPWALFSSLSAHHRLPQGIVPAQQWSTQCYIIYLAPLSALGSFGSSSGAVIELHTYCRWFIGPGVVIQ